MKKVLLLFMFFISIQPMECQLILLDSSQELVKVGPQNISIDLFAVEDYYISDLESLLIKLTVELDATKTRVANRSISLTLINDNWKVVPCN